MTDTKHDVPLDDVLNDMALTSAKPDANLLAAYIRRYPEYADEITDFAAELAALAISGEVKEVVEPSTTGTSPALSRALSRLQNRLYEVKQEQTALRSSAPDLFGALDRGQFRALAEKLGVNTFFLTKVRDRTIAPETIPHGFRLKVADLMRIPEPEVATYFAGPAKIPEEMRFLSEQKPEAAHRQSFADAVRSSSLTGEQQQYLLAL